MLSFESPANPSIFRSGIPGRIPTATNRLVSALVEDYPEPVDVAPGLTLLGPTALVHVAYYRRLVPDDLSTIKQEFAWLATDLQALRERPGLIIGPTHRLMAIKAFEFGFEVHKADTSVVSPGLKDRFERMHSVLKEHRTPVHPTDTDVYVACMKTTTFIDKFGYKTKTT